MTHFRRIKPEEPNGYFGASMVRILTLLPLLSVLALAGCSSSAQNRPVSTGPVVAAPVVQPAIVTPPQATPAQVTADARAMTNISDFLDPTAVAALTPSSLNQAAGAQFNVLQFGRPGAPRNWQGDNGASGQVTVGPYVRVNSIDCRDYTHVVTISGKSYSRKGTACRAADGHWTVTDGATG